ncbi:hypothetical protein FH972_024862 [Carpinus fangiana]|uniref:Derlin n=1 Tax=Carpinus fangiana TaxID=176857 RepID=A0A5N6KZP5_9ROSI|nr:hypothetical protein FH972_024862 [Carpinus fangiana]
MDAFYAAPPITRTITACVVVTSLAVYGGIVSSTTILFYLPWIFGSFPPQLWRLITAFWLTKPKLSIVLDPYFLFIYGSQLERESTRFSSTSDFFVYVAFIHVVIVALCGGIFGGLTFLQPLTLAFVYTFAQDNLDRRVSLFVFQIRARYLPYAMLLITFIMESPGAAWEQVTGLLAAHAYEFLTRIWPTVGGGRNYLETPRFVKAWFSDNSPAPRARGYGTAFNAGGRQPVPAAGPASGWSSALSGWGTRGPGRRLGGE